MEVYDSFMKLGLKPEEATKPNALTPRRCGNTLDYLYTSKIGTFADGLLPEDIGLQSECRTPEWYNG